MLFKTTQLRVGGSSLPMSTLDFSQAGMALAILGVPTAKAEFMSQCHCRTVDLRQSCQEGKKKENNRTSDSATGQSTLVRMTSQKHHVTWRMRMWVSRVS